MLNLCVTLTLRDVLLEPVLTATFVGAKSNLGPLPDGCLALSGAFAGIELPG